MLFFDFLRCGPEVTGSACCVFTASLIFDVSPTSKKDGALGDKDFEVTDATGGFNSSASLRAARLASFTDDAREEVEGASFTD